MLLLLLLLLSDGGRAQRLSGKMKDGSCVCTVDSRQWTFPTEKYEAVLQKVQTCGESLKELQVQMKLSGQNLPVFQDLYDNITARLEPHQYLNQKGLYSALSLRRLGQELSQLETNIGSVHSQLNNAQTKTLSKEVDKLRSDVDRMQMSNSINMQTVREKLRNLKNRAESCRTLPKDFRGSNQFCYKGLITSISDPVVTTVSPYGKNQLSGSWGKQAQMGVEQNLHWVQPLVSSNIFGNTVRVYQTYEDFMASANHKDVVLAPSHTHANSIEGSSAVLYGEAFYYHCYRSADVCRYDLQTKTVKRVSLPGSGVGINNKYPYCYYDCQANSDIDVEADESGLWALYATVGNHGNIVASRLVWDADAETLNVSQTWETRLFKKSVSNAFMVCGVLYATRYVDESHEEVFYAFDTATGKEDNSLVLPLQKVAKGVSSLSYNPTNRQIYMYNDGYLLAYQVHFLK